MGAALGLRKVNPKAFRAAKECENPRSCLKGYSGVSDSGIPNVGHSLVQVDVLNYSMLLHNVHDYIFSKPLRHPNQLQLSNQNFARKFAIYQLLAARLD